MSHQLGTGIGYTTAVTLSVRNAAHDTTMNCAICYAVIAVITNQDTVCGAEREWMEVTNNGNSDQRDHQRDGHHRGAGHERGVYRCAWQKRQVERMMSFFHAESVLLCYWEIVR